MYVCMYNICVYVCVCVRVHVCVCVFSCSVLFDSLWPHGPYSPGSPVHWVFQTRIVE